MCLMPDKNKCFIARMRLWICWRANISNGSLFGSEDIVAPPRSKCHQLLGLEIPDKYVRGLPKYCFGCGSLTRFHQRGQRNRTPSQAKTNPNPTRNKTNLYSKESRPYRTCNPTGTVPLLSFGLSKGSSSKKRGLQGGTVGKTAVGQLS